MNRPYTVCHIFSALDGAIAGNYMYVPETAEARRQYGALRSTFNSNAILYGTTTMLDFCNGYVSSLPKVKPIDYKDYVAPHNENKYVIAIDRYGKLAYSQSYLERHGLRQHIIEVLTEQASDEYLAYLQELGISYIFAGINELKCEIVMAKLKRTFWNRKTCNCGWRIYRLGICRRWYDRRTQHCPCTCGRWRIASNRVQAHRYFFEPCDIIYVKRC